MPKSYFCKVYFQDPETEDIKSFATVIQAESPENAFYELVQQDREGFIRNTWYRHYDTFKYIVSSDPKGL